MPQLSRWQRPAAGRVLWSGAGHRPGVGALIARPDGDKWSVTVRATGDTCSREKRDHDRGEMRSRRSVTESRLRTQSRGGLLCDLVGVLYDLVAGVDTSEAALGDCNLQDLVDIRYCLRLLTEESMVALSVCVFV